MIATSAEMPDEPGLALDSLAQTILDEIYGLIDERTRLCHLASGREGGSDAEG